MSSDSFKNCYLQTIQLQLTDIYINKQDLVLNNIEGLICHKTQATTYNDIVWHGIKTKLTNDSLVRQIKMQGNGFI